MDEARDATMPDSAAIPAAEGRHEVAEYALLGLLREGPAHGYRLAEAFAPEGRLGATLHLKLSQLYAYLHKLERLGWVTAHDEMSAGATRPRRVFTLTEPGRIAFEEWLVSPVAATRELRLDFLLKLAFAAEHDVERAVALVHAQRTHTQTWLARLRMQQATTAEGVLDLRALTLGYRVRQTEAVLLWLDDLGKQLRR